jgi:hypothetical protein
MASFPLWAAIRTVKSRVGTWVGFEQVSAVDPSITRTMWGTLVGQARAALSNKVAEVTRPLNRRPLPTEVTPYGSRAGKTGFMQYVDVYVRPAHGGPVETRPWAMRTDTLRSRGYAVTNALARYEAATLPEGTFEGETIVGASYAGTVEFTPL